MCTVYIRTKGEILLTVPRRCFFFVSCFLVCSLQPCVLCLSVFCYALLCVHSSFALILKRRRKLIALLLLSYRCIVTINVIWLFLTVTRVGLQFVIVVFPDHTHLLLWSLAGRGLASGLSCVWCLLRFCHFLTWCSVSGVVLDYIDSCSLPPYYLYWLTSGPHIQ